MINETNTEARRTALLTLLRAVEWSAKDADGFETCPVCGRHRHTPWGSGYVGGHRPDCEMKAAIEAFEVE